MSGVNVPRVGEPSEDGRYRYMIGYMTRAGGFGRFDSTFAYPITGSDVDDVEALVRQTAPGAVVIAVSPIAPPRTRAAGRD